MTPDDRTTSPAADSAGLRRSLRDLVALTMLPTVWAGYRPRQICEDLVDVLARMVDADGILLISTRNDVPELVRLKRAGDVETERSMRDALGSVSSVQTVATADGALRLLTASLSLHTTDRLVVAARRADFPNEMERLTFSVAINQASTWLN